jgi:hypothetical protein
MKRALRGVGLCALVGAVLAPIVVFFLRVGDTGHVPVWIIAEELSIAGALAGAFVAAVAFGFEWLVSLSGRRR